MLKAPLIDKNSKFGADWFIAVQDEIMNVIKSVDEGAVFDGSKNEQLKLAIQEISYWGGLKLRYNISNFSAVTLNDINLDPEKINACSFVSVGVASTKTSSFVQVQQTIVVYNHPFKIWRIHDREFSNNKKLYSLGFNDGWKKIEAKTEDISKELSGTLTISQIKYWRNQ